MNWNLIIIAMTLCVDSKSARAELPPAWKEAPKPTTGEVDQLINSEPPSGDPNTANPIERRTLQMSNEAEGALPQEVVEPAKDGVKVRKNPVLQRRTLRQAAESTEPDEAEETPSPIPAKAKTKTKAKAKPKLPRKPARKARK